MFVVPIQTYILIYKKIYEHWGVAGTLVSVAQLCGPLVAKISVCRNIRLRILDQRKKSVDLIY